MPSADDDRSKLMDDLASAVDAARDAIASAADALGSSRRTQRIARMAIRDAKATAEITGAEVVARPADGRPDPAA